MGAAQTVNLSDEPARLQELSSPKIVGPALLGEDDMVKVALQVGHPSYESSHRFEVELPHLPRNGEYVRAEPGMLRRVGAHAWADLWNVLAVVHERPGDAVVATLHVVPAAMRDLFELLEGRPRR